MRKGMNDEELGDLSAEMTRLTTHGNVSRDTAAVIIIGHRIATALERLLAMIEEQRAEARPEAAADPQG